RGTRRRPGAADRCRPRRRHHRCRRHPDGDALRAQPDRRLPLAGRTGDRRRLRRRRGRPHHRAGGARVPVTYWAEYAWLSSTTESGVLIDVDGGRFTAVRPGVASPPPGATVLRGLTLPGLANAHSHAFHRALRGRTHGRGTFWTWRERMYALAGALDPDSYH